MAFVGTKQIGQTQMKFNADGSVELLKPLDPSSSAPQKPAPQQVVEQVVEKAKEMVGLETQKKKPGRRRKAD